MEVRPGREAPKELVISHSASRNWYSPFVSWHTVCHTVFSSMQNLHRCTENTGMYFFGCFGNMKARSVSLSLCSLWQAGASLTLQVQEPLFKIRQDRKKKCNFKVNFMHKRMSRLSLQHEKAKQRRSFVWKSLVTCSWLMLERKLVWETLPQHVYILPLQ